MKTSHLIHFRKPAKACIRSALTLGTLVLLSVSACRKAASSVGKEAASVAEICFKDTLHTFGAIPLSNPIDSFDFRFTNTGNGRLVVLGVETSCRCTRVFYPQVPVEPDGESFIRVIYDGRGKEKEYFDKSIRVITNARKDCVTLRINGRLGYQ